MIYVNIVEILLNKPNKLNASNVGVLFLFCLFLLLVFVDVVVEMNACGFMSLK